MTNAATASAAFALLGARSPECAPSANDQGSTK